MFENHRANAQDFSAWQSQLARIQFVELQSAWKSDFKGVLNGLNFTKIR